MKKVIAITIFLLLPTIIFGQATKDFSTVKTKIGEVKIPGDWEQMNTMDDSGQTYLKNEDGVVIAVARNPQNAYAFYNSKKSAFENVQAFYKWDSDWRKENKFKTNKIKENAKLGYVIWKYNDTKSDSVFLFGSSKNNFLNLLVYTENWTEEEKITFLEDLYKLNK